MSSPPSHQAVFRAALWMAVVIASFSLMAIAARALAAEIGTFEILFFRSVVSLAVVSALLWRRRWVDLSRRRIRLHLFRNLTHFWGQASWFHAISVLGLAEVFAIEFTTPIWTVLLAALLLRERLSIWRLAAVTIGFVGVMVMLRPGVAELSTAHFIMLGGAIGFAFSIVATKSLTADESPWAILFFMNVIQLPIALAAALPSWAWPSPALWPWIVVLGLTGISAHYSLARALSHADASVVIPIDFLRLPVIMVVGYLVYAEAVSPWLMAGALIIFAANYLNVIEAKRLGARP